MVARPALLAIPVLTLAAALAGCDGGSDAAADPPEATTATAPPGPAITALNAPPEAACRPGGVRVTATWATVEAEAVALAVDDEPVTSAAGHPAGGSAAVTLPCDDARHVITLTAEGGGAPVSASVAVTTVPRGPRPRPRPAVLTLTAPASAECTNAGAAVPIEWTTRDATTVEIGVDGEPLSADAGEPAAGAVTVPLPCDGRIHRVAVTAYGVGSSAATHAVRVATVPEQPAGRAAIARFTVPAEVRCTGRRAAVPASWTTTDAARVAIAVDGLPVRASARYPASGARAVPVPCDAREHTVVLTAVSPSGRTRVRHAAAVNTVPRRVPAVRPAITRLTMPTRVGCPAGAAAADVRVAWRTRGVRAVRFMLDGRAASGPAALPATGTGMLAVPCDGTEHAFTLVADGAGTSIGQARRPITAEPPAMAAPGGATTGG